MAYNKHERYGLTLGSEDEVEASPFARNISYYDKNYIEGLANAFNHALTPEDLLNALDVVWVPLGSTELLTDGDPWFPVKNFTEEFYFYKIIVNGIKASGNNGGWSWAVSTDNGVTWQWGITDGANKYSYSLWREGATPITRTWASSANTIPGSNNRLLDADADAYLDMIVLNPADPDVLTQGVYTFSFNDPDSTLAASVEHTECFWSHRVKESVNAIGWRCGGGFDWTSGKFSVWGLRASG